MGKFFLVLMALASTGLIALNFRSNAEESFKNGSRIVASSSGYDSGMSCGTLSEATFLVNLSGTPYLSNPYEEMAEIRSDCPLMELKYRSAKKLLNVQTPNGIGQFVVYQLDDVTSYRVPVPRQREWMSAAPHTQYLIYFVPGYLI